MLTYIVLFLFGASVVLILCGVREIRRLRAMVFRQVDTGTALKQLFRQLECLQSLYADLKPEKSLPSTRGWAASPDFLLEVARHALQWKPEVVVECSSGTSTIILARCMQLIGQGVVYSMESDSFFADKTRLELQRHGLEEWAQVLDAPLRVHTLHGEDWPWYAEECLPPQIRIDLLVVDGPPGKTRALARYPVGPVLFPLLSATATVFVDDAARPDEQAMLRRWAVEFPSLHQELRRCEKGCAVLSSEGGR